MFGKSVEKYCNKNYQKQDIKLVKKAYKKLK